MISYVARNYMTGRNVKHYYGETGRRISNGGSSPSMMEMMKIVAGVVG